MELILGFYTDNMTYFTPHRVGGPKAGKRKIVLGRVMEAHLRVAIASPGLGMIPGGARVAQGVVGLGGTRF